MISPSITTVTIVNVVSDTENVMQDRKDDVMQAIIVYHRDKEFEHECVRSP